jgi:hypothetical protein
MLSIYNRNATSSEFTRLLLSVMHRKHDFFSIQLQGLFAGASAFGGADDICNHSYRRVACLIYYEINSCLRMIFGGWMPISLVTVAAMSAA